MADLTITEAFLAAGRAHPSVAVTFVGNGGEGDVHLTLGELLDRAGALARGLAGLGVRAGDEVVVHLPNTLEGFLTTQAALALGTVVVPIPPGAGSRECAHIVSESTRPWAVVSAPSGGLDLARSGEVAVRGPVVVVGTEPGPGEVGWEALVERPGVLAPPDRRPSEVCMVVYTSGTTGRSKGVLHTHTTLLAAARASLEADEGDDRSPTWLVVYPPGHMAGVLWPLGLLLRPAETYVMDRWDPALGARLVAEHGISHTAGTPLHLRSLLQAARDTGASLATLRSFMLGSAAVTPAMVQEADEQGVRAFRAYGASECPRIAVGRPADALPVRAAIDGYVTRTVELRVVGTDGGDVAPGDQGEVQVRGGQQFVGYRAPGPAATTDDGWYATGDIGVVGPEGTLTIVGRLKEIIIRGGENISPWEIEEVLHQHPDVAEVAVFGVPDEMYGERACAAVVCTPGGAVDLASLRDFVVAAGLDKRKAPERLIVLDSLPRTAAGKVAKNDLRSAAAEGAR